MVWLKPIFCLQITNHDLKVVAIQKRLFNSRIIGGIKIIATTFRSWVINENNFEALAKIAPSFNIFNE
jgi:hypothetical protein